MFVSEPIAPEPGSFRPDLMVQGLAALPAAFTWRGERYVILECLRHVKQSSPEGHKAGAERYLRRQVFTVRLDTRQVAEIYVERQARPGTNPRGRWFLYTIDEPPHAEGDRTAPEPASGRSADCSSPDAGVP